MRNKIYQNVSHLHHDVGNRWSIFLNLNYFRSKCSLNLLFRYFRINSLKRKFNTNSNLYSAVHYMGFLIYVCYRYHVFVKRSCLFVIKSNKTFLIYFFSSFQVYIEDMCPLEQIMEENFMGKEKSFLLPHLSLSSHTQPLKKFE